MDGTGPTTPQNQLVRSTSQRDPLLESRILIIDDERSNVLLLERILERENLINFLSITDPRQAAALFAEFQPDLVLTDLAMPEMDGFAVMETLRHLTRDGALLPRSEEHTSELQSHSFISYAVFCLKKKQWRRSAFPPPHVGLFCSAFA